MGERTNSTCPHRSDTAPVATASVLLVPSGAMVRDLLFRRTTELRPGIPPRPYERRRADSFAQGPVTPVEPLAWRIIRIDKNGLDHLPFHHAPRRFAVRCASWSASKRPMWPAHLPRNAAVASAQQGALAADQSRGALGVLRPILPLSGPPIIFPSGHAWLQGPVAPQLGQSLTPRACAPRQHKRNTQMWRAHFLDRETLGKPEMFVGEVGFP